MMENIDALKKRNFHLALSITNGQELAHLSGFSVPSEDVQKHEIMDVISKWLVLHNVGILDEIHTCADWVMSTTQKVRAFDKDQLEASRVYITSFAIAMLIHLFDNHYIDYAGDPSLLELDADLLKRFITGEHDDI